MQTKGNSIPPEYVLLKFRHDFLFLLLLLVPLGSLSCILSPYWMPVEAEPSDTFYSEESGFKKD